MNCNVLLITVSFPYSPGEEFLETEIKYFEKNQNICLTIIPLIKKDKKRELSNNIKIDEFLVNSCRTTISYRIFGIVKSLFTKVFYREIQYFNILNIFHWRNFLVSVSLYKNYYDCFESYFQILSNENHDFENMIIYTYWNTESTYALQSLKNKYGYKLVSRIHGFDLYEERRIASYMPLKRQFVDNIDIIFTITESANNYLCKTYNFQFSKLLLSRLGVEDLDIISHQNEGNNKFHLVSCSFMTEVKQLDKIIFALEKVANSRSDIDFIWSHIGDGYLYKKLLELAHLKLSKMKNVHVHFLGHLDNNKVYEFYKTNTIDVFINVSKSEGVPVSIMEAMSCRIPVIAPNIGGIADMIENNVNGLLLSKVCTIDEIVESLNKIDFFKNTSIRENAYKMFLEKYNAKTNYSNFIENLISLKKEL